jgi:hypothetical protein
LLNLLIESNPSFIELDIAELEDNAVDIAKYFFT